MSMAVIKGEALWTSKKMLKVPGKYRAEYANLLPLASVDGTFEYDPLIVWRTVYAVNREENTEFVEEALKAFVAADMIRTWEEDGKTWATFVGIEKPGRLLPPSQRWGKNRPPVPPPEVIEETPRVAQKGLPYFKIIPKMCRDILGVTAGPEEWYKKPLKELGDTYGGTELVTAFDDWAKSQTIPPKNPVQSFIRVADGYLQNKVIKEDASLDALCVSLYQIGSQPFAGKNRQILNSLLHEFSFLEIEKAYKSIITNRDDYDMKFAVRDFCEGGARAIILAARKIEEQLQQTKAAIEDAITREQATVELPEEEIPEEL